MPEVCSSIEVEPELSVSTDKLFKNGGSGEKIAIIGGGYLGYALCSSIFSRFGYMPDTFDANDAESGHGASMNIYELSACHSPGFEQVKPSWWTMDHEDACFEFMSTQVGIRDIPMKNTNGENVSWKKVLVHEALRRNFPRLSTMKIDSIREEKDKIVLDSNGRSYEYDYAVLAAGRMCGPLSGGKVSVRGFKGQSLLFDSSNTQAYGEAFYKEGEMTPIRIIPQTLGKFLIGSTCEGLKGAPTLALLRSCMRNFDPHALEEKIFTGFYADSGKLFAGLVPGSERLLCAVGGSNLTASFAGGMALQLTRILEKILE